MNLRISEFELKFDPSKERVATFPSCCLFNEIGADKKIKMAADFRVCHADPKIPGFPSHGSPDSSCESEPMSTQFYQVMLEIHKSLSTQAYRVDLWLTTLT
eukprot:s1104_g11.t1